MVSIKYSKDIPVSIKYSKNISVSIKYLKSCYQLNILKTFLYQINIQETWYYLNFHRQVDINEIFKHHGISIKYSSNMWCQLNIQKHVILTNYSKT